MKKTLILSLALVALCTTSCTGKYEEVPNYQRIGSPTGAPAVIFYDQVENYHLTTYSTPSNLLAHFQDQGEAEYGAIVFDFQQGLSSLVTNGGDYKLARILTGGNLYLVGIDHDDVVNDELPNDDSYIVGFGSETSVPVRVFKYLYPELGEASLDLVSGADQIPGIMSTKKNGGEYVDYVIAAEPSLTNALTNVVEDPSDYHVVATLKDLWADATGLAPVIPQAGLFINQTYYKEYPSYYEDFLANVEESIDVVINDPALVRDTMNNYPEELADTIGVGGAIVYKVQTQASNGEPNGLAVVSAQESESLDFTTFLTTLGIDDDFSHYLML